VNGARGGGVSSAPVPAVPDFDLDDLAVFVRVVDRSGFAVAARELGVPTSTVSRTIARLEARTGTRLLHRTTRSVTPTSDGREIYASVAGAVATLERAARSLEPATRKPKGLLRVTAPNDIGGAFLAEVAVAFTERYPLVQVELVLTNRAVNLVDEGLDVAVRASARLADSTLVARKVGDLEHVLYASPRYIETHGAPASPRDLDDHRCVVFRAKGLATTWTLEGAGGAVDVPVRGRIGGDDFAFVRSIVLAGGGIGLLPRIVSAPDEHAGRLVRVLPDLEARGAGLYVVYPSASQVPARVTAFRDFVTEAFAARVAACKTAGLEAGQGRPR
jgi:DNA-binding transcriptional LysR family regulator